MSSHSFIIEIARRLSLLSFTESMVGRVVLGSIRFEHSMVSLLKVPYLVELLSHCITDSVTNARACGQVYQRAAYCTFLANFSLGLYWRIYFACISLYFVAMIWIAVALLTRLV